MQLARFLRFALVGGFATGIQYLLLIILVHLAGAEPVTASAVGFVVSAFANYIINYHFTFASNQRHIAALSKFSVLASIGLFLNSAMMSGLIRLGLHYLPAQVMATVVVLLWNFVGNSLWTFRAHTAQTELRSSKRNGPFRGFFLRQGTVLWLLLLAMSVRALIVVASNSEAGDFDVRAFAAARWAQETVFSTSGMPLPFHVYLADAFAWLVSDPITAGKWVSFLTGSLTVIPFYRLVNRLFDGGTAWISAAFLAFYGDHVAASSSVLSDAPFCFLALWGVDAFFAETLSKVPRLLGFLGAGIILALAGGFQPQGSQLAGILSLYLLFFPPLRKYALPFGLTSISTFAMWLIANAAAGQGLPPDWLETAFFNDHEATDLRCSTTAAYSVQLGCKLLQSPGPLIFGLAGWGLTLALKRRVPLDLAIIATLLVGLDVLASLLKPQWAAPQRSALMFGILVLPYAAAATRSLLATRFNLKAVVAAILAFSVCTQALACGRWVLPQFKAPRKLPGFYHTG